MRSIIFKLSLIRQRHMPTRESDMLEAVARLKGRDIRVRASFHVSDTFHKPRLATLGGVLRSELPWR